MRDTLGSRLLEALLFAVSSLVLYSFGLGRALFLVPLQVIAGRRGTGGIAAAGGIAVLGLAGLRLAPLVAAAVADPAALTLVGAEVAFFLLAVAGLAALGIGVGRVRTVVRLLAVSVGVAALGAPLVAALAGRPEVRAVLDAVFTEAAALLGGIFQTGDSVTGSVLDALLEPAALKVVMRETLLHGFLPVLLAWYAFSWWAGSAATRRAAVAAGAGRPWRFAAFRLEAWWVWPLIVSLAAVLVLALVGDASPSRGWPAYASYAAWNAALVMLFLFGLQGLAILRFLLEKRGIARLAWPVVVAAVAVAFATPRVNVAAGLVLPLFGASENWVRYRRGGAAPT